MKKQVEILNEFVPSGNSMVTDCLVWRS